MTPCKRCGGSGEEPPPVDARSGEHLRELRESLGIGLREMGRRLGKDPSYLSRVEHRGYVSHEQLLRLAKAYSEA